MLVLSGVTKQYLYGKRLFGVLDAVVGDGEILSLYGGEGSGKTTFLKAVAGIEEVDGKITLDGKQISSKTDDVIMAFDDCAVFPLKTVYGNLAYPLKIRKTEKSVIRERITAVAKDFGIDGVLKNRGYALSRDERIKLSFARLFLRPAKLLLVDEPRGGLDEENYSKLISKLREVASAGTTVIYATSERKRALDADEIVVLVDGDVKQIGDLNALRNHPSSVWSAEVADEGYIVEKATLTRDNGRLNLVIHKYEDVIVDFTARENEVVDGFVGRTLWCGLHSDVTAPDAYDYVLYDVNENSVMKGL